MDFSGLPDQAEPSVSQSFDWSGLPDQQQAAAPQTSPAEKLRSVLGGVSPHAQTRPKLPIGTVILYGPDDRTATKIAAAIVRHPGEEPTQLERWVGTNILNDHKVTQQIQEFLMKHGAKTIVMSDGVLGCPHEEGEDFPVGEDCPFCPFWAGKQGTARRDHD